MTPMIPMHLADSSKNVILSVIVEIKPTTTSCAPIPKKVSFKIKTPPLILVLVVAALEEDVANMALEVGDMEVVVEVNITMIEVIKVLKHFKMNNATTQIHYQAIILIQIQANNAIIQLSKVKVLNKLLTQIS